MTDIPTLARLAFQSGRYPDTARVLKRVQCETNNRYGADLTDAEATLACIELTMLRGAEAGLPPLTALYNIVWYNDRPCIWGDVAKAMIMSHAEYEGMDYYIEPESITMDAKGETKAGLACTYTIKRKGKEWTARYSLEDAKRAGLADLPHYQRHLDRMLQWRAFFIAARDAFPDVLNGLSIAEEQRDVDLVPEPEKPKAVAAPAMTMDPFTAAALEGRPGMETVDYVSSLTPNSEVKFTATSIKSGDYVKLTETGDIVTLRQEVTA